jgi:hypothetical protein
VGTADDSQSGPGERRPSVARRFWIEEGSGRVVKSELVVPGETVETTFMFDDSLQLDVPVMMHDNLGTATYSRFRRFGVQTDEKVGSPAPPR